MMQEAHVRLLDEGTEVFRPVAISHVRGDLYRIDACDIPSDEFWEFQPGEVIKLKVITTDSGADLLVVVAAESASEREFRENPGAQ